MFSVPVLVLNEAQRQKLKTPLGELVAGEPDHCISVLKSVVEVEKPVRLILVGDTISRTALQSGIQPSVIIIDRKEKRLPAANSPVSNVEMFRTRNKPGSIGPHAWKTVDRAIQKGNSAVLVEGEEDLLTLPAIMAAPIGSLVVYGQPHEGIILVRVTPVKKEEIQALLAAMRSDD
jgi:uncharacterized protein (UPF0218 family)